jgi:hypothetical protein
MDGYEQKRELMIKIQTAPFLGSSVLKQRKQGKKRNTKG